MALHESRVELLLGRRVRDVHGRKAGRIEEIIAEADGDELVVKEYHLGPAALAERFAHAVLTLAPLHLLGKPRHRGRRVPWAVLDVEDPHHLTLTCAREELEPLGRDA